MAESKQSTGHCLCNRVRFTVASELRDIVYCHCGQCFRQHGSVSAYTAAPREALKIEGVDHLQWYESSTGVRRGFCRACGSSLFWDSKSAAQIAIAIGVLDDTASMVPRCHIYTADRPAHDHILDDLPQYPGSHFGSADDLT